MTFGDIVAGQKIFVDANTFVYASPLSRPLGHRASSFLNASGGRKSKRLRQAMSSVTWPIA